MRGILSFCAVLLLAGCGSTTPQSFWNDVTDFPKGYQDAEPSRMAGPENSMGEADAPKPVVHTRRPSVMLEDRIESYPEPTQISK